MLNNDIDLDPVFAFLGQKVYTYEFIDRLRDENLIKASKGEGITSLVPQKGFQEDVTLIDADLMFIGGKRGGGKTWVSMFMFLPYIFNPRVTGYGFRRIEKDVYGGIFSSSKLVFSGFGTYADTTMSWNFLGGRGARFLCEHLQDPSKISDRFRGREAAFIDIEEVTEHTRTSMKPVFDLLKANRTTAGVKPRFVCTCNPVGKSNKLRHFLDWYIDPDTNIAIPERSGKKRYFYNLTDEISGVVFGDTWQEVYSDDRVRKKVDKLSERTGASPESLINSVCFIDGDLKYNKILLITDPRYISRATAGGDVTSSNEACGIWADADSTGCEISENDIFAFYENQEQNGDGIMRGSCDVALSGDFLTLFAIRGRHIVDVEAWVGIPSTAVVPFIRNFLKRNHILEENFTYDSNGLGFWLKDELPDARPFNNKSEASDTMLWANLKSESADAFTRNIRQRKWSIDDRLLSKTFTDKSGKTFNLADRIMEERLAMKFKEGNYRKELIKKSEMKVEVGHSPDFIEGLMMSESMMIDSQELIREGYEDL